VEIAVLLQFTKAMRIEESPHRTHARTAVALAHADVERAALLARLTEFLDVELGELVQSAGLAGAILRLVDEIRAERPPTPFEIAHVAHARTLQLARSRVRCHAVANGHTLGVWRTDPARPGCEEARCTRCGAAAAIPLGTAREHLADALLRGCER
jgi:hypothetical protein